MKIERHFAITSQKNSAGSKPKFPRADNEKGELNKNAYPFVKTYLFPLFKDGATFVTGWNRISGVALKKPAKHPMKMKNLIDLLVMKERRKSLNMSRRIPMDANQLLTRCFTFVQSL